MGQSWHAAHPVWATFSVWTEKVRAAGCDSTHVSAVMFTLMITLYLSHLFIFMSLLCLYRAKNTVVFLCLSLDAYESAKLLCEQYYLGAPELELRQMNGETHTKHCDQTPTLMVNVCVWVEYWLLFFLSPSQQHQRAHLYLLHPITPVSYALWTLQGNN